MKHLLTLALLVCLGTFASAQIPSYVPTNGLVGWWPFNGNANDESGNGNHGTVNGATLTSDRNSSNNAAYSFNGSTSYIAVLPSSSNSSVINEITISCWIYSNDGNAYSVSKTNQSLGDYRIVVTSTNYAALLVNGVEYVFNNVSLPTNQWYHLAVTKSSSLTSTIYINGIPLNNAYTNIYPQRNPTTNIEFGRDPMGLTEFHDGKLDDIGIWNRALTSQEISNLYRGANVSAQEIQPSALQVYPNPANHEVTLQVLPHHLGKTVTVVNTLGQNVLQTQLQNERQTLSLEALPAGFYTAFLNDDRRTTVKLIKE